MDNQDGTVTDTCTGLTWEKEPVHAQGGWQHALVHGDMLSLGGHDDWRLPNVRELQSIVDHARESPAIDPVIDASIDKYWSSTTSVHSPFSAWCVETMHGRVEEWLKDSGGRVLAVRNAR